MSFTSERKSQLEDNYILNFERALEVRQRRNQLLAAWLVAKNRRNDPAYAEKIVQIGSEEPADAAFCHRIIHEVGGLPTDVGEEHIQERMRALFIIAADELAREQQRPLDKS